MINNSKSFFFHSVGEVMEMVLFEVLPKWIRFIFWAINSQKTFPFYPTVSSPSEDILAFGEGGWFTPAVVELRTK